MPAPTFTLTQTIPTCTDSGAGSAANETALDRGNVDVHANCCRTYGTRVRLVPAGWGSGNLNYEGTVSTCSNTATGTKVYSSDLFQICGGNGLAFTGAHSGNGTITGSNFTGSGRGNASGGATGSYVVNFSGSFSSPGNGTFAGTITGAISGTLAGTITAGVVDVVYTLHNGGSAMDNNTDTFTITGGGTTFTFTGAITGTNAAPVRAYWHVEWAGCSIGQVVAQMLLEADDSVVVEYANDRYAVKNGRLTILNRRSIVECGDNPCPGISSSGQAQKTFALNHIPVRCFIPDTGLPSCLGGVRDKVYTLTLTGGDGPLALGAGATGNSTPPNSLVGASTSGTSSATFALTGTLNWFVSGISVPQGSSGGVTMTVTFSRSYDWSVTASVDACRTFINGAYSFGGSHDLSSSTGATASITGGTLPGDLPTSLSGRLHFLGFSAAPTVGGSPSHDYCSGNLTLTPSGQIVCTVYNGSNAEFQLVASASASMSISQSGNHYP